MAVAVAITLAALAASAIQQNWEAVLPVLYWSGFLLVVAGALFLAPLLFEVLGVYETPLWAWPLAVLLASVGWFWATGFGDVLVAIFFWVAVAGSVVLALLALTFLEDRFRIPWDLWLSVPSLVLFAWFPAAGWFFGLPPLLSLLYRLQRYARRTSGGYRTAPPPGPGRSRPGPSPSWDYEEVEEESEPPPPRQTPPVPGPDREPQGKDDAVRIARELFASGNRGGAARVLLKAGFSGHQIEGMMEILAREGA